MSWIQIIEFTFGGLISLGAFAGGIGYLISAYVQGKNKQKDDGISSENQLTQFWKDQVTGFKDMLAEQDRKMEVQRNDYNTQIKDLSNQLSEVKGQLMEKEKTNKEYLAILQNRNPELEQFMKALTQASSDQAEYRKESKDMFKGMITVLGDIHTATLDNNKILHEEEKDLKIEATVTKT